MTNEPFSRRMPMKDQTLTWGCYERLKPSEIESIRSHAPLAYIPWGALEWHSYHAPVGLDGMQAQGQCVALARVTGGVVLPPVYVGTDTIKPFKGFPHTVEHGCGTVERLCLEFLEQLAEEQFRAVVIVTGHCGGGHVEALRTATETFNAAHTDCRGLLIPSFETIKDRYPSNHAARGETSFQMLFAPDLVDLSKLPEDRAATLDDDGVWGDDPREASADEGAQMLDLFVRRTIPLVNELIEQHNT